MEHDDAGPGPIASRHRHVALESVVRRRDRDLSHIGSYKRVATCGSTFSWRTRSQEAAGRFGREGGTRSLTRHSSGRGFGPHVDHLALKVIRAPKRMW